MGADTRSVQPDGIGFLPVFCTENKATPPQSRNSASWPSTPACHTARRSGTSPRVAAGSRSRSPPGTCGTGFSGESRRGWRSDRSSSPRRFLFRNRKIPRKLPRNMSVEGRAADPDSDQHLLPDGDHALLRRWPVDIGARRLENRRHQAGREPPAHSIRQERDRAHGTTACEAGQAFSPLPEEHHDATGLLDVNIPALRRIQGCGCGSTALRLACTAGLPPCGPSSPLALPR